MGYVDIHAIIGSWPESRDFHGEPFLPDLASSCKIEAFATVDAGTERATSIGPRAWLMKHSHVGHDAIVWDDCELSPGAVVCGFAVLERGVRVGVNASILPYRRVGAGARIGAGAVVTKDVPPGEVWAGNPARNLHPPAADLTREYYEEHA